MAKKTNHSYIRCGVDTLYVAVVSQAPKGQPRMQLRCYEDTLASEGKEHSLITVVNLKCKVTKYS